MKSLTSFNSANFADLVDYSIVDETGDNVGAVHSMWADADSGQLEFLGVKTGWIFGSNHVIPAEKAQIDEATRTIKVPYPTTLIQGAPVIDADATISDEEESEIFRYYSIHRGDSIAASHSGITGSTVSEMATDAAAAVTGTAKNAASAVTNAVTSGATSTARATDNAEDREITLSEEQVKVGKRTVEAGSVRLRKIIRTEIVNQPVEVRREEVVVERVSADQVHAGTAASDFKDETIDVPLTREEVVVSKEAHVTGAVRLHKTEDVETQNVSETVRKEDVEVLRDGQTDAAGSDKPVRR